MKLRPWLLSVLAICFLGMTCWAQGQSGSSGGMMSAGGGASQQPNANQQPKQQTNGNQNPKEEAPPQAPTYLTYTKEANPGLTAGKSSGMESPVNIGSAPVGADVSVNGYYVGKTPTTVQLPPGQYIITVNKWAYQEYVQVLDVSGGKPASINPTLHGDW